MPLVPRRLFLFFTDGLSEAMNRSAELFGEQRLRDLLEASARAGQRAAEGADPGGGARVRGGRRAARRHDDGVLQVGGMTMIQPPPAQADLVLRGGSIWAGQGRPRAQALAARGGRVLAVGRDRRRPRPRSARARAWSTCAAAWWCPASTTRTCTSSRAGFGLLSVDLRDAADEAELARRLGGTRATLPKGAWIRHGQLGPRGAGRAARLPARGSRSTPPRRTIPCSSTGSTATWRSPTRWP